MNASIELCANVSPHQWRNHSVDVNGGIGTYIGVHFTTDYLEIAIYIVCLAIGGPLNIYAFVNSMNALVNHGTARFNRLLILRINLNIADLLTMFVYTLTQIVWMSTFQWHGGDFLCRLCKFFYTFSFYLNSFIVVSIALDRVYTTYHLNEFKAASAMSNVRVMICVAWTAATLLSLPQMFIFRVFVPDDEPQFEQCAPIWTIYHYYLEQVTLFNATLSETFIDDARRVAIWERVYNWMHLLTIFWIPALIILLSYVSILSRLQNNISGHVKKRPIKSLRRQSDTGDGGSQCAPRLTSVDHGFPLAVYTNGDSAVPRPTVYRPRNDDDENGNAGGIRSTEEAEQKMTLLVSSDERPPILPPAGRLLMMRQWSSRLRSVPWQRSSHYGHLAANTMSRAKRKTMQKAAMILIAYFTFWTPYNLLALINMVTPNNEEQKELTTVTLAFLNSLIVVNAIANPLIYGVFERRNN